MPLIAAASKPGYWLLKSSPFFILLALVVRRFDNAFHRMNPYSMDSAAHFVYSYALCSDLTVGKRYPPFEQLTPEL